MDVSYSEEWGVQNVAVEITLEICSYLDIHDQLAMRRVCKSWRSNLPPGFLSKYVDMDTSKMSDPYGIQPTNPNIPVSGEQNEHPPGDFILYENLLELALNIYVQKSTKVLVIRRVDFHRNTFAIVVRVIKDKKANLIQIILKDCELQEECATDRYWFLTPQRIAAGLLLRGPPLSGSQGPRGQPAGLVSVTRRLTLDNLTIRSIFEFATNMPDMYGLPDRLATGIMSKKLPITLPRLELDCRQPLRRVFHAFMMAVDAQCPPVGPETRADIVQLWSHCQVEQRPWRDMCKIIKCLNDGVPVTSKNVDALDSAALRQLDPLALNRLATEVLHRLHRTARYIDGMM